MNYKRGACYYKTDSSFYKNNGMSSKYYYIMPEIDIIVLYNFYDWA